NCAVEFKLPAKIATADATLSITVADGGTVEPIAKTIPILLNTVNVAIYPEGGDLVAGLPSRVYVEARTPAQKPADIVGTVVDADGNEVATLRTEHEGRGRFDFTPKSGGTYALRLSQPIGIEKPLPLPAVKETGVSLRSDADITPAGHPITLHVAANKAGTYAVALTKRQTEI